MTVNHRLAECATVGLSEGSRPVRARAEVEGQQDRSLRSWHWLTCFDTCWLFAATLPLMLAGCAQRSATVEPPATEPSTARQPPAVTPAPTPAPTLGGPTPPPTRLEYPPANWNRPCYPADVPVAAAEDNPQFGDYVYVEELPEAIEKVPPLYPES